MNDVNCDSQYKFMGPHLGVLYGKYELLDRLQAYKVRPAPVDPPGKYETGTQNHEGIAGTLAAVSYLAGIGEQYGKDYADRVPGFSGRRLHLKTGMTYLGNGTLISISGWFDLHLFNVDDIIHTESGEHGCANCLRIRDKLLIPEGYPKTEVLLRRFGEKYNVQVQALDISEFEKGGGSLTCLSLIW